MVCISRVVVDAARSIAAIEATVTVRVLGATIRVDWVIG
jgi:hypothetical protein